MLNYSSCLNCKGTGIFTGLFCSSVCAICDGLGLLTNTGEKVEHVKACKMLKNRYEQLSMKLYRLKRLSNNLPAMPPAIESNTLTNFKSKPLDWKPQGFHSCEDCNGTGVYVGIVSRSDCGICHGIGVVLDGIYAVPDHELVAVLASRNKAVKREIAFLMSIPFVTEQLARQEQEYIENTIR